MKSRRYYKHKSKMICKSWYVYDRKTQELVADCDFERHATLLVRLLNKEENKHE